MLLQHEPVYRALCLPETIWFQFLRGFCPKLTVIHHPAHRRKLLKSTPFWRSRVPRASEHVDLHLDHVSKGRAVNGERAENVLRLVAGILIFWAP